MVQGAMPSVMLAAFNLYWKGVTISLHNEINFFVFGQ